LNDQRAHERYSLWFPIRVANPSGDIEAICRDGSAGGVLVAGKNGAQDLEVGESVFITLPHQKDQPILGRVVRIEPASEPGGERRIAIEFIKPFPELERLFRRTSSRPPPPG
jgi:hypothetical protein